MYKLLLKRFALLFLMMFFTATLACDVRSNIIKDIKDENNVIPLSGTENMPTVAKYTDDGRRIITIGTWYDLYYVSKHLSIYDDPNITDPVTAQMKLDKMREIEEKYHIVLNYVNLTYDGVFESINSSVPEGNPDVDIYEIELVNGISSVLKNYAIPLEEIGVNPGKISDGIIKTLKLPGQDSTYLFTPVNGTESNVYVLAFNMNMIREAGLENPQDLYDRGEWTWDKWREYLKIMTKDINGDGITDIYGYDGFWTNLLSNLMFSNGTGIASGEKETLSSPETIEVLKFINDIYNIDKTARPWDDSNWDINDRLYADGLSAFWIGSDWIFNEFGGASLPFEIGVVPWPCGPSGDINNNKHCSISNKWYFLPQNIKDPELVYSIIYDWSDWYGDDLSIVDDNPWSRNMYMNDRNYSYIKMMSKKQGLDLWEDINSSHNFSLVPLISGVESVANIVRENKDFFQNLLDELYY